MCGTNIAKVLGLQPKASQLGGVSAYTLPALPAPPSVQPLVATPNGTPSTPPSTSAAAVGASTAATQSILGARGRSSTVLTSGAGTDTPVTLKAENLTGSKALLGG